MLYMYVSMCVGVNAMAVVWRSEEKFQELGLSFDHIMSRS